MNNQQEYYVGIDMGTNSVGWAVTDPEYHLLRAKGKDMWGSRLFDKANTAAERRSFRVARRRRQRETARIGELRNIFADEINKKDPGFYCRLEESKFFLEDRSEQNQQRNAVFNDKNFTDRDYFKKYPTIFHLRKDLLESSDPHDVRLVYLALLNMFKHRGHFLNKSMDAQGSSQDMSALLYSFASYANEIGIPFPAEVNPEEVLMCLKKKGVSKKKKQEELASVCNITRKEKAEYELIGMMCGLTGKLVNVFAGTYEESADISEIQKLSLSLRDNDYENKAADTEEILGEERFDLINKVKEIHDAGLLADIMEGETYLSFARVKEYDAHQKDLKLLKGVLKKYSLKEYHKMFRVMGEGNYSAYVGSVNSHGKKERRNQGNGRTQEAFYKYVKGVLKGLSEEAAMDPDVLLIQHKIDAETFMPKQLTASNGVIPNQVHSAEMKKILSNAESYLPFLKEKDETGLTVSEKILQLFSFQIPFYVGPLGQQYRDVPGYNVWAERIAPGKIYPWNINEKIDLAGAAEKFISRMVRHCTYLMGENALPRNSLLYEQFMVLNELNNLKVHGEKISVNLKQSIYRDLFKKGKKVTGKALKQYLILNGIISKEDEDAVGGIDQDFKASLSSYGKFLPVFDKDIDSDSTRKMIEQIIFWGTVYGESKSLFMERVQNAYGDKLSEAQMRRIKGFKFSGWGQLSYKFLTMEGASTEDGEIKPLISAMWDTNNNLMELLSSRYTYQDKLEELCNKSVKPLTEWTIQDLEGQYLSPAVKRMVWQTIKILREIETVMGCAPDRIFVEMPRENGEKGVRQKSRKQKLLEIYNKEEKEWEEAIADKDESYFQINKVYLYYQQMGRCMYTGEPIEIEDLFNDNLYDIDHIYPQHYIKDDSIDQNRVLVKKQLNAHKSDTYPIEPEIQTKMHSFWKMLMSKGLISKGKYERLIRKQEFTQEEKAAFINRQIVETRQGTRAITQILGEVMPDTKIVFPKASLVSDFRRDYKILKARSLNHLHHAKDAYLNIVVGNCYFTKFTDNPLHFLRKAEMQKNNKDYQYHMGKLFGKDISNGKETVWIAEKDGKPGTIALVRKTVNKNTPLVTRRSYIYHGGLTQKSTVWSAKTSKKESYIGVKTSDPRLANVERYGGVRDIAVANYALISYKVNNKEIRSLEAVPLIIGEPETIDNEKLLNYFIKSLQNEYPKKRVTDVCVRISTIRHRSRIRLDGFEYYLGGKTGSMLYLIDAMELKCDSSTEVYIHKIEKALERKQFGEVEKATGSKVLSQERNLALFDLLTKKIQKSVYANKKGSIGPILEQGRESFAGKTIEEQCGILMEIITWFNTGKQTVDLQLIGGSLHAGTLRINKKISGVTECKLLECSSTGLWNKEVDLLTV